MEGEGREALGDRAVREVKERVLGGDSEEGGGKKGRVVGVRL